MKKETSSTLARLVNHSVVGFIGVVSAIYLFNPGAGFIEFIPDNIPVLGNLDEAGAAALLLSCLAYFGLDITRLFGQAIRKSEKKETPSNDVVIDLEQNGN